MSIYKLDLGFEYSVRFLLCYGLREIAFYGFDSATAERENRVPVLATIFSMSKRRSAACVSLSSQCMRVMVERKPCLFACLSRTSIHRYATIV